MQGQKPHIVVFANEKGGTGKSTTAVHTAVALVAAGHRVAAIDLDVRQRTLSRYLENREATARRRGVSLPSPKFATLSLLTPAGVDQEINRLGGDADFVIIDTPGKDDPAARGAMIRADTIVTPMNDSFVDLDLIGQVDAETFRVKRPSFFAELVWEQRKSRANADGATVDWVVLRNRLQQLEALNMQRVGKAIHDLAKRVGYRVAPGLSERVIYRELFPQGLTLLDQEHLPRFSLSHVAARQELREMIAGLGLALREAEQPELAMA